MVHKNTARARGRPTQPSRQTFIVRAGRFDGICWNIGQCLGVPSHNPARSPQQILVGRLHKLARCPLLNQHRSNTPASPHIAAPQLPTRPKHTPSVRYGMGNNGTVFLGEARRCAIENCRIVQTGRYGVCISGGGEHVVRRNDIAHSAQRGVLILGSGSNEVSDNHIHDCGAIYKHIGRRPRTTSTSRRPPDCQYWPIRSDEFSKLNLGCGGYVTGRIFTNRLRRVRIRYARPILVRTAASRTNGAGGRPTRSPRKASSPGGRPPA